MLAVIPDPSAQVVVGVRDGVISPLGIGLIAAVAAQEGFTLKLAKAINALERPTVIRVQLGVPRPAPAPGDSTFVRCTDGVG
jgi:uncharacterized membrane protein